MSDYVPTKHERESAEAREALWNALGRRPDELFAIASALTAAEERGRRSGVEAIMPIIRGCQTDLAPLTVQQNLTGDIARLVTAKLNAAVTFTRLDAALAPRDSGKEGQR